MKSFLHGQSRVNITVFADQTKFDLQKITSERNKIWTWGFCKKCQKSEPIYPLSQESQGYSFAKLLELYFYGVDFSSQTCEHSSMRNHVRYFGHKEFVVEFEHETIPVRTIKLPDMKLKLLPQHAERPTSIDLEGGARIIFDYVLMRLNELEQILILSPHIIQVKVIEWQKAKTEFYEQYSEGSVSPPALAATLYNYALAMYSYLFDVYSKFCKRHKVKGGSNNLRNSVMLTKVPDPHFSSLEGISPDQIPKVSSSTQQLISNSDFIESNSENDPTLFTNDEVISEKGATSHVKTPQTQFKLHQSHDMSISLHDSNTESGLSQLKFSTNPDDRDETESRGSHNSAMSSDPQHGRPRSSSQAEEGSFAFKHRRNLSLGFLKSSQGQMAFTPSHSSNTPSAAFSDNLVNGFAWRYKENNNWIRFEDHTEKTLESAWQKRADNSQITFNDGLQKVDFNTMTVISKKSGIVRKIERLDGKKVYDKNDPKAIPTQAIMFSDNPTKFFQPLFQGIGALTPLQENTRLIPSSRERITVINEGELGSFVVYFLCSDLYKEQSKNFDAQHRACRDPSIMPKWLNTTAQTDIVAKFNFETGGFPVQFYVSAYFAKHFEELRKIIGVEEFYISSLSFSAAWNASGGKSKATWARTNDGRFLMKEVSNIELESFRRFAPSYFAYLWTSISKQGDVPTMLGKIFGMYRLTYKTPTVSMKKTFAVMENLFYGRDVTRVYDLKGSRRSRYVQEESGHSQTLMDENLLEVMFTSPMYVSQDAKTQLNAAVWNDTIFLSSLNVMDYSCLVGIDEKNNEIIVGIIDYLRKYTWDKQMENWVKSIETMTGRGEVPTVISPVEYKTRFIEAMNFYFVLVPELGTQYEI